MVYLKQQRSLARRMEENSMNAVEPAKDAAPRKDNYVYYVEFKAF